MDAKADDRPILKAAQLIAGGSPPEWLLSGLQQLDWIVGAKRITGEADRNADGELAQARQNIAQLVPFLERLKPHLPYFFEADELAINVGLALEALPVIAKHLPKLQPRPRNRPGDQRYQLCAALVVEGWRLTQGVEPTAGGRREAEACQAYWKACGHDGADGGRDWERDLRAAIRHRDQMIRDFLHMLAARAAKAAPSS